eukprot:SAG31_NODE_2651_length_5296_cov_2.101770_1_plen_230_part_00
MVMKAINLNVSCGATAIISRPNMLGSNVESPIRQCIGFCIRMINSPPTLAVFQDIHTGAEIHSNNYTLLDMPVGTSPYIRFGLPSPALTNAAVPRAEDYQIPVQQLVELSGYGISGDGHVLHEMEKKLRELADVPNPEMKAHDSHGRIVIRNKNGDWVLIGERVTASTDTSASRELYRPKVSDDSRIASIKIKLKSDPKSFCGESVFRRFVTNGDVVFKNLVYVKAKFT